MSTEESDAYLLSLHKVAGLGPVRLKLLLNFFPDPKTAWRANQKDLQQVGLPENVVRSLITTRQKLDPENYLESIRKFNIRWLTIFDDTYPQSLKEIYDPPFVLFYLGQIPATIDKSIGIVGTRKVTGYGKLVTEKFSSFLAPSGMVIVSGLARGVDTVAVLGGGLNSIFPPENRNLALEIASGNGAVISEFVPDEPSLPGNFPARNRIISGLSLGVLVSEAAEESGSLITAKCALEQGREVFAIPGPIEVLEEFGLKAKAESGSKAKDNEVSPSDFEKILHFNLDSGEEHIDELCRELKVSILEISATLIKLEILGVVKNLGGGIYSKV